MGWRCGGSPSRDTYIGFRLYQPDPARGREDHELRRPRGKGLFSVFTTATTNQTFAVVGPQVTEIDQRVIVSTLRPGSAFFLAGSLTPPSPLTKRDGRGADNTLTKRQNEVRYDENGEIIRLIERQTEDRAPISLQFLREWGQENTANYASIIGVAAKSIPRIILATYRAKGLYADNWQHRFEPEALQLLALFAHLSPFSTFCRISTSNLVREMAGYQGIWRNDQCPLFFVWWKCNGLNGKVVRTTSCFNQVVNRGPTRVQPVVSSVANVAGLAGLNHLANISDQVKTGKEVTRGHVNQAPHEEGIGFKFATGARMPGPARQVKYYVEALGQN
ncbi:hypothetical protein V8F20_010355 [Naviculisporaceae sp. PSN 640]